MDCCEWEAKADVVVLEGNRIVYTDKVAKLTATQVVLEKGARFRRQDSREVGGSGYFKRRVRPAAAYQEQIDRTRLAEALIRPDGWPIGKVRAVLSAIDGWQP